MLLLFCSFIFLATHSSCLHAVMFQIFLSNVRYTRRSDLIYQSAYVVTAACFGVTVTGGPSKFEKGLESTHKSWNYTILHHTSLDTAVASTSLPTTALQSCADLEETLLTLSTALTHQIPTPVHQVWLSGVSCLPPAALVLSVSLQWVFYSILSPQWLPIPFFCSSYWTLFNCSPTWSFFSSLNFYPLFETPPSLCSTLCFT